MPTQGFHEEPERTRQNLDEEARRIQGAKAEDFEPTKEELQNAGRISDQLVQQWREQLGNNTREVQQLRIHDARLSRVDLRDVSDTIGKVAKHSNFFLSKLGSVPCITLPTGEMPICSTGEFFGSNMVGNHWIENVTPAQDSGVLSGELDLMTSKFLGREDHPMLATLKESAEFLHDALSRFLSHRFGAYRQNGGPKVDRSDQLGYSTSWKNPGDIKNGSIYVSVQCNSLGLRVHSSPAYFVDWQYFGHPSDPLVQGWLLPGRYIFATDGPGMPEYISDNGVVAIPSTYKATMKRF